MRIARHFGGEKRGVGFLNIKYRDEALSGARNCENSARDVIVKRNEGRPFPSRRLNDRKYKGTLEKGAIDHY